MQGGTFGYARAQFDVSAYHPVSDSVVAAGRIRLGTIVGASAFDVAPSRRFYSGGGGSVRGYGYQQLGPRDLDGDPVGGRGLAEFGLEARVRLKQFGGNFGIVPFVDGGSLTTEVAPQLEQLAFRGGSGRPLLFELRSDPHRRRRSAQPRRRATDPSRSRYRWVRLLIGGRGRRHREGSPPPPRRLRSDWQWRLLNELFAAFVALLFLAAGALVLLDTAPGHRFIVDRIGRLETASGLKIRIGRIDGSIFGKSQLKNVAVSDRAVSS